MPVYEYEHLGSGCSHGKQFEFSQPMNSERLSVCPFCNKPVKRLLSVVGFTKLVRRDNGVYENVTATGKESRIWDSSKPETMPHLHKKIRD